MMDFLRKQPGRVARTLGALLLCLTLFGVAGCGVPPAAREVSSQPPAPAVEAPPADTKEELPEEEADESTMKLWIDETEIPVIWEENETVGELRQQVLQGDVTVSLSMYSNNEQVGPLGRSYPRNDVQTTTHNGDIVLYSGDQIVVFYGSNSWAYTRLGKMDLEETAVTTLLSNGDVTLRLSR